MQDIYVKYNPYTVATDIIIEGVSEENMEVFSGIREGVRLQEWVEPNGEWLGFFGAVFKCLNCPEAVNIKFQGTETDFEDLKKAGERYGEDFGSITYELEESKNQEDDRLAKVSRKLEELMDGPYEELKEEKLQNAFRRAIADDFEVLVVAPMSSGKSTLINSILGTDLLPALNSATTATITKIKNDDNMEGYTVSCSKRNGKVLADNEPATLNLIRNLNEQAKDIESINITGNIPNIPSGKVKIVFVDTPGGNNTRDERHMAIMKEAISDENKGMILYVFNFTQLETGDNNQILSMVAQAMGDTTTAKHVRDRFIFVCNKMDAQNPEKEPYENIQAAIRKYLEEKGIENPNLFFTCSDACKLIRMKKAGVPLSDADDDRLYGYLRPFNRPSRQLFRYCTLPDEDKEAFLKKIDELAQSGDRDNLDIAEINSGVPALEKAISTYVEKYAVSIKVKTVYDAFTRKVDELQMISKSQQQWAKSQEDYENMRNELASKKEEYEKSQKLQEFKEKIDTIETDYTRAYTLENDFITDIKSMAYAYPDNVKMSEVRFHLEEFRRQLIAAGERVEAEFDAMLEEMLYKQCKEVIGEYNAYVTELDERGLLNIGEYSFKKTVKIKEMDKDALSEENITDEYVHSEIVDALKIKKKGLINAIKRLMDNIEGWDIVNVREDFVSLSKYMTELLEKISSELVYEFEKEIRRARINENKIKDFVKAELNDIDAKVKEEYEKIQNMTEDKSALEEKAEKDRYNMEWLNKFVDDMNSIMDI